MRQRMQRTQRTQRTQKRALVGFALIAATFLCKASLAADLRLVEAARKQDRPAIASLLKESVDVNAAQPDGGTALHWAAQWNDLATAGQLLAAGAQVNAA